MLCTSADVLELTLHLEILTTHSLMKGCRGWLLISWRVNTLLLPAGQVTLAGKPRVMLLRGWGYLPARQSGNSRKGVLFIESRINSFWANNVPSAKYKIPLKKNLFSFGNNWPAEKTQGTIDNKVQFRLYADLGKSMSTAFELLSSIYSPQVGQVFS